MSSKYKTTNFSIKDRNTYVIILIKVLGLLDKPNDMIIYSYNPFFILKDVFIHLPGEFESVGNHSSSLLKR